MLGELTQWPKNVNISLFKRIWTFLSFWPGFISPGKRLGGIKHVNFQTFARIKNIFTCYKRRRLDDSPAVSVLEMDSLKSGRCDLGLRHLKFISLGQILWDYAWLQLCFPRVKLKTETIGSLSWPGCVLRWGAIHYEDCLSTGAPLYFQRTHYSVRCWK